MTTHYDVLGVRSSADPEAVKRAYYRKARRFHPDAHAGSSAALVGEAQRAMAELNAAWSVLGDAVARAEYDNALEQQRVAAASSRHRRAKSKRSPVPQLVGKGFRYWFGPTSALDDSGERRLALAVEGARDLSVLRTLGSTGLWALHAQNAALADAQLVHLRGMTGLQVLDLSHTPVSDAGLLHLQDLPALDTLMLWGTRVTDAGLALIARLPALRVLGLGNTAVTDAGLAHIAQLRGLRILQLWGTEVTGHGLVHLHGLLDLDILSLPWRVRGRDRRRIKAALPAALVA
ncbi:MAG: DnaJ domain-containing protein [Actinobacteria bacterium]|nr:DnaJ domain-containing protein [Actinomycetota bacterium]